MDPNVYGSAFTQQPGAAADLSAQQYANAMANDPQLRAMFAHNSGTQGSTNMGQLLAATAQQRIPNSMLLGMSPLPTNVECPHCKVMITTEVNRVRSRNAYTEAALCIACCWCIGAIFVAAMWSNMKETAHFCPQCKQELGRYKRGRRHRH